MDSLGERLRQILQDRYLILRELGRGGSATVYLADDLRHGRRVALKVLDPALAAAVGPERFLREIQIEARLTHPHILPLHDSGSADGVPYYVMPFVEGESLRDLLAREPQLPVENALRYTREVAEALAYAHEQGVVHRDIKPENILIERGHAVVTDFGIARALDESGGGKLTQTGVSVGTPAYMSPEQAAGDGRVDGRSDIYSLGCVLFEMLAGRAPFVGANTASVVHQHLSVEPPRVTDLRPAAPPGLDAVIIRALAKSPADRYGDAEQFLRALEEAERAPTPLPASSMPSRRALRLPHAVVASLLAATLAAGWWLRGHSGSGRIDSLAVLPLSNLSGDPQQEYFADGMTEELIAELSQISALRVISRTSAMAFKNARRPLPEIARRLGVDALMEGSVLRAGERVRINAELIQARPERHLWGERYERPLSDVLALQSEVAQAIARRIAVALTPQERQRLEKSVRVNPAAHDEVLKGRFFMSRFDVKSFQAALDHFNRAVEADPGYAAAWSGVADAYYGLSNQTLPPAEAMEKARAAARKALELAPDLPAAHASLGVVLAEYDWDWAAAEREYRLALGLDPNNAQARLYFALLLTLTGRYEEAFEEYGVAHRLDPLSTFVAYQQAFAYYLARRYDDAARRYIALESADTNSAVPHYSLGLIYEAKGMLPEAIAEYRRGVLHWENGYPFALLAHAYAVAGYAAESRRILRLLEHPPAGLYVGAAHRALVHLGLGEQDRFFELMEESFRRRDEDAIWFPAYPQMDPVRSNPRFRDLLRRLNLPGG